MRVKERSGAEPAPMLHERSFAPLEQLPRHARMALAEQFIVEHMNRYGVKPSGDELERLADALLYEELTDADPYKVSRQEYPILSETQLKRRKYGRGAAANSNMRGEASLGGIRNGSKDTLVDHIAADGLSYAPPTRRARTLYESMLIEANSVSRVAERAETYRRSTLPGKVTVYYKK